MLLWRLSWSMALGKCVDLCHLLGCCLRVMITFTSIDFEIANQHKDSVCAIGVATGQLGEIQASRSFLIRPPTPYFEFTRVHGIRWEDVRDAPSFRECWPKILNWLKDARFIAAHNASFDQDVLRSCCDSGRLSPPNKPFICTVELARMQWGIYPTSLPAVCRRLRIPLRHHDPRSDAEACARIVLAAEADGWNPCIPD